MEHIVILKLIGCAAISLSASLMSVLRRNAPDQKKQTQY
jgi:hypothetical protein